MTDNTEQPKKPSQEKDPKDMTPDELEAYREKKIQERIAELRKRDPFIYR